MLQCFVNNEEACTGLQTELVKRATVVGKDAAGPTDDRFLVQDDNGTVDFVMMRIRWSRLSTRTKAGFVANRAQLAFESAFERAKFKVPSLKHLTEEFLAERMFEEAVRDEIELPNNSAFLRVQFCG